MGTDPRGSRRTRRSCRFRTEGRRLLGPRTRCHRFGSPRHTEPRRRPCSTRCTRREIETDPPSAAVPRLPQHAHGPHARARAAATRCRRRSQPAGAEYPPRPRPAARLPTLPTCSVMRILSRGGRGWSPTMAREFHGSRQRTGKHFLGGTEDSGGCVDRLRSLCRVPARRKDSADEVQDRGVGGIDEMTSRDEHLLRVGKGFGEAVVHPP